jgi:hypothetical protein
MLGIIYSLYIRLLRAAHLFWLIPQPQDLVDLVALLGRKDAITYDNASFTSEASLSRKALNRSSGKFVFWETDEQYAPLGNRATTRALTTIWSL